MSALPQSLEGVLLRAALEECINSPPWRSASRRIARGLRQGLVFWELFITAFFFVPHSAGVFENSPVWDSFGAFHAGAFWKLSAVWLFKGSPP